MADDWSAWTTPPLPPGGGIATPGMPGTQYGLLGQNPWQYLGDIGFGMLAQSGPSLTPQGGFGARLGRAGLQAQQLAQERTLNDARRFEMGIAAKEQAGLAAFSKWAQDNPELAKDPAQVRAAALQYAPELAVKGMLANQMSPLEALLAQGQLTTQELTAQGTRAKLADDKKAVNLAYRNLSTANAGFERLKEIPGGDALLNNPLAAKWIRAGLSGNALTTAFGEAIAGGAFNIPKEDLPDALSAFESISKAQKSISGLTQDAVASQRTALEAFGAEGTAGLDVQHHVIREQLAETKAQLEANEWGIPEQAGEYPFNIAKRKREELAAKARGGAPGAGAGAYTGPAATPPAGVAGGIGYQNGQLVPQPAPQSAPYPPPPGGVGGFGLTVPSILPPAAAPPVAAPRAAPPARAGAVQPSRVAPPGATPAKVPTVPINPRTGQVMKQFPRPADAIRHATKTGQHAVAIDPADGQLHVYGPE